MPPQLSHPPKDNLSWEAPGNSEKTCEGTPSAMAAYRRVTASYHPAREVLSYTQAIHWWIKKLHVAFTSPLWSLSWLYGRDQQHLGLWQKRAKHCVILGAAP